MNIFKMIQNRKYQVPQTEVMVMNGATLMQMATISGKGGYGGHVPERRDPLF